MTRRMTRRRLAVIEHALHALLYDMTNTGRLRLPATRRDYADVRAALAWTQEQIERRPARPARQLRIPDEGASA